MFISKADLQSIRDDIKRLYKDHTDIQNKIWELQKVIRELGYEWQPPNDGKWAKK